MKAIVALGNPDECAKRGAPLTVPHKSFHLPMGSILHRLQPGSALAYATVASLGFGESPNRGVCGTTEHIARAR